MASSMSRIDMWQPEQPSSHAVASLIRFIGELLGSLVNSSPGGQARDIAIVFHHLLDGEALFGGPAGGAPLYALPAIGAVLRLAADHVRRVGVDRQRTGGALQTAQRLDGAGE